MQLKEWFYAFFTLAVLDILSWLILVYVDQNVEPVSRRLANLGFIVWMVCNIAFVYVGHITKHEGLLTSFIWHRNLSTTYFYSIQCCDVNNFLTKDIYHAYAKDCKVIQKYLVNKPVIHQWIMAVHIPS